MDDFDCHPRQVLCVGDSIQHDVNPAMALDADACVISEQLISGYTTVPKLEKLLNGHKSNIPAKEENK